MQLRQGLKLSLILGKKEDSESTTKHYGKLAGTLILVVLVFCMAVQLVQMEMRIKKTEQQYRDALYQKELLVKEQQALKEELTFVQSDAYIREMARSKLGMLMPNEIMFVKR